MDRVRANLLGNPQAVGRVRQDHHAIRDERPPGDGPGERRVRDAPAVSRLQRSANTSPSEDCSRKSVSAASESDEVAVGRTPRLTSSDKLGVNYLVDRLTHWCVIDVKSAWSELEPGTGFASSCRNHSIAGVKSQFSPGFSEHRKAHSATRRAILMTPGPWRISDHDDCEIYTADGSELIGTIARPCNAMAIAVLPELVELVFELAEQMCRCLGAGTCSACRAQRVIVGLPSASDIDAA